MARTEGVFVNGISVSGKRRYFSHEFQTEILEFVDRQGFNRDTHRLTCQVFQITPKELGRTLAARRHRAEVPGRIATAQKERNLRDRLQERAVAAVEDSLDPLDRAIEKTELLKDGLDHLGSAVNHLKNRGLIATKVLEGIGDFRRAGDDIPKDAPRQPLFNLPPGSRVAISVDISSEGGIDDGSNRGETESREIEVRAERVDTEVQREQPRGGDRENPCLNP